MASRLSYSDLVSVFGADGVARWPTVPEGVADPAARSFLAVTGLPLELAPSLIFTESSADGEILNLPAYRDEYEHEWPWCAPGEYDDWFAIGECDWDGTVFLDGATGRVNFVPSDGGPPTLMNSSVADLAYFMYAFERDRHRYTRDYARGPESAAAAENEDFLRQMKAYPSVAEYDPEFVREKLVYRVAARDLAIEFQRVDPAPFAEDAAEVFSRDPELNLPEDFAGPWTYLLQMACDGDLE